MKSSPAISTYPPMIGRSRPEIAVNTTLPIPGQAKIDSTTIAPARMCPNRSPSTLAIGTAALRSTWRTATGEGPSPLARAVRTWSCPIVSSIRARVRRISEDAGPTASASVGSTRWRSTPNPATGSSRSFSPNRTISAIASQKPGIEASTSVVTRPA